MDVLEPSVVLAPYLEPIVRGRRVVVLGDSTGTLAPSLLDRGARLVHVYDPDAARAAESAARAGASRTLVIAPLPWGDLAVRDGAFDTAIVPDLSAFGSPDPVIERARRLVSPTGTAIFASPNPDIVASSSAGGALSYYELFDAVSLQFSDVRMLGQAPFAGYVIADFAPDDEPDVVVDTSLLERGSEEPQFFLAVASRSRQRLDAYTVVQVPQTLLRRDAAAGEMDAAARLAPVEAELHAANARIRDLEDRAQFAGRVPELEAEIDKRAEQLRKIEARAGDAHVRAGQLENKVRDLEEELRHQRERAFRLSTELEEEKKRSTKVALELGMIRRTSELPPKPEIARPEDIARIKTLEADLEASRSTITRLQGERDASSARISELQANIAHLQAGEAELQDALEDMRAVDKQAAKRIAELEAAVRERTERVRELDAQILELNADTSRGGEHAEQLLADAQSERDAALAALESQRAEHEAEVSSFEERLRSQGHDLAEARAEVTRREQLVRELLLMLEELRGQAADAAVAPQPPAGAGPSAREHELAAQCARREAELQRATFRIQELEGRLAQGQQAEPSDKLTELESALHAAHNEIDALRTSLKREHEEREQIETRAQEALAQARADLQEQAVLAASAAAGPGFGEDAG